MSFLFTEEDLEYVSNLFQKNIDLLMKNKKYKNNNCELSKIAEIVDTLPSDAKKLFEDYDRLYCSNLNYNMCLAYYIGMQKGLKINEKIK